MSLTIDGKHISELNLQLLRDHQNPAAPSTRDNVMTIPGMHGAYDFGASLGVKEFLLPVHLKLKNEYETLSSAIRKVMAVFIDPYGKPKTVKLIFDYEPDKYYMVRYSGNIPINRLFSMGKFELPLTAYDPHAYSIIESTDDVYWGDNVPFLSDIPLEIGASKYVIATPQTLNIDNFGSQVVRPIVEITGSATSLTLTVQGESFSLGTFTNSTLLIDAERYAAIKNGQSFLFQLQGNLEKLELMPGTNAINVGGSNLNINIAFKYRAKYV
ncbi:phage tail family protein [Bacillus sp. S70]|uniref:distal tail protein Dit n=1 Tax=unclassified Bacillus (in: firmicutes) TaxID=185979 RepID=UPI00190D7B5B|nr:phage tail family protein [Bacillus sp. S29]MBK0104749.1 phage tail family protein [Bacillus sp. S70]MBK0110010.1 phage tail family protein [Bacillus sp. S73]MBK0138876.1 phage tail family protein [Bacillus sp. S72]MBK0147981.1 phage tail family protein [Bacillus sp. S74]MBK0161482.1 phage tail family protein [Bacillus sp. S71]